MTDSLSHDIHQLFSLLPESIHTFDEEKRIDPSLQSFSSYFIDTYYSLRNDHSVIKTISQYTTHEYIQRILDSRRLLENETFLKLLIIWCSLRLFHHYLSFILFIIINPIFTIR